MITNCTTVWQLSLTRVQIHHKHGTRQKYSNKDTDTSGSGTPKTTFQHHQPKVNQVQLNEPYEYINTRDNTNEYTPLVNETDEHLPEEEETEEEDYFDDFRDTGTPGKT